MEKLGLIIKMHGNLGWQVSPNSLDDLSNEVKEYLLKHGQTEETLKVIFKQRQS